MVQYHVRLEIARFDDSVLVGGVKKLFDHTLFLDLNSANDLLWFFSLLGNVNAPTIKIQEEQNAQGGN